MAHTEGIEGKHIVARTAIWGDDGSLSRQLVVWHLKDAFECSGSEDDPTFGFTGRPFRVVRVLDEASDEISEECIPMFEVEFADGKRCVAFPDEVAN
jgi:hypothetical protein